jgi:hypothetical protein
MKKLQKYIVPVELTVFGESEADAIAYVQDALDHCDLLEQDGIVGVNPDIDELSVDVLEDDE